MKEETTYSTYYSKQSIMSVDDAKAGAQFTYWSVSDHQLEFANHGNAPCAAPTVAPARCCL